MCRWDRGVPLQPDGAWFRRSDLGSLAQLAAARATTAVRSPNLVGLGVLSTLSRHPRPRIRWFEAAGQGKAAHSKVVLWPRAYIRTGSAGRSLRPARLQAVRAYHFGSLACNPLAGSPSRRRMAAAPVTSANARISPRARQNSLVTCRSSARWPCACARPSSGARPSVLY